VLYCISLHSAFAAALLIRDITLPRHHRYIHAIVMRQLIVHRASHPESMQSADSTEFATGFAALICTAQEAVRQCCSGERAAVSRRDVARCAKVFCWLLARVGARNCTDINNNDSSSDMNNSSSGALFGGLNERSNAATKRAVVLALTFCYHARLPRRDRAVSDAYSHTYALYDLSNTHQAAGSYSSCSYHDACIAGIVTFCMR
jgi:hypothetical protein